MLLNFVSINFFDNTNSVFNWLLKFQAVFLECVLFIVNEFYKYMASLFERRRDRVSTIPCKCKGLPATRDFTGLRNDLLTQ